MRAEAVAAAVTGALAVITLLWRDWIEAVFGVDPDHGNGAVEWWVVGALAAATGMLALLALADRRRLAVASLA